LPEPAVLILDEPGTGLDPAARLTMMNLLNELCREGGVTALLTTHLVDEADRCDAVAILDHGHLVAHGTPAALKRRVGGDVVTVQTSDPHNLARRITTEHGVGAQVTNGAVRMEGTDGLELASTLARAFAGQIESVSVRKPSLEDVFFMVTGHDLENRMANEAQAA